jgi:hypothetical protein
MDDSYPKPVSDPAADGLPEYADDDSTAYDDVLSPRQADGPDPAPLPPDREDGPLALDDYGTTAEEQRVGEPLEERLAREEPDAPVDPDDPGADVTLPVAEDDPLPGEVSGDAPVDPHLGSPVSMYDRPELGVPDTGAVGRLVRPDQGAHPDDEATEVATDEGAAGGGASAEELAIHRVPPEEEPDWSV